MAGRRPLLLGVRLPRHGRQRRRPRSSGRGSGRSRAGRRPRAVVVRAQRGERVVARGERVHEHERDPRAAGRAQREDLPDDDVEERQPVLDLEQRLGARHAHRRAEPAVELETTASSSGRLRLLAGPRTPARRRPARGRPRAAARPRPDAGARSSGGTCRRRRAARRRRASSPGRRRGSSRLDATTRQPDPLCRRRSGLGAHQFHSPSSSISAGTSSARMIVASMSTANTVPSPTCLMKMISEVANAASATDSRSAAAVTIRPGPLQPERDRLAVRQPGVARLLDPREQEDAVVGRERERHREQQHRLRRLERALRRVVEQPLEPPVLEDHDEQPERRAQRQQVHERAP